MTKTATLSRRSLLKSTGMLVVSIGASVTLDTVLAARAQAQTGKPPLAPDQLDSFIALDSNGRITGYFGKMDMGHGLTVAIAQIIAEELDVPVTQVNVVMGDTAVTVNQGGASGSTGLQMGGKQMRLAAAEARRILVSRAAEKLGVPAAQLAVADGVVSGNGRSVKYGELVGTGYFNAKLKWNNQIGNGLEASGEGTPKPFQQHKVVGKSIKRDDVAPRVFGTMEYVSDVRVPGMVHGRMIRPPVAGAAIARIDESSVKDIPNVRVVRDKDLLGVVADTEWDAIRASQNLKVEWTKPNQPFPEFGALYDHIRKTPAAKRTVETNVGDLNAAFSGAAKVVEAEYEWPFQSHASMGPGCAVVEITGDSATLWTGSQKPHFARDGVAAALKLDPAKVRATWVLGPGCYGRNDAGDAAIDAALLSKAVGKPVRVQGMRHEGHGWDPKGPASIHRARAALDAGGKVIGYEFLSKGLSRVEIQTTEANPAHSLSGQLMGLPTSPDHGFGVPAESYEFGAKQMAWETIPALIERASPLRTSHLRDPVGPQIHFASESFMDEVAAAVGADPVEFRLRYLKNPRDIAVVKAAAEKAGWQPRPSPRRDQPSSANASGRGIAYSQRSGTIVAVVAEVEIDRRSGKIWVRKFTVAHDCGQIVNPEGLRLTIEGNIIQGISRSLWEEVKFDRESVTSVDWLSYPILDITEAPESIETVLINHPELPMSGAGEPSTRPVAAAIANAIFDATGVRLRRVPFTPDRVKAAMA